MALNRVLSLTTLALLLCSVVAQSPTSSPKKSPSPVSFPPPTVSAPSPSKTPTPSSVEVSPPSSSVSPDASPSLISGPPAEAPGPAENSAALNFNSRFGVAGSVAIGLLMGVMAV